MTFGLRTTAAMAWLLLTAAAGAQPLRVMTYNIRHGEGVDLRVDLKRIAEVIRAERPDVVCLQEVDRGMERTGGTDQPRLLGEMLGMTAVFEPNRRIGAGEYGNATLSRLPVVEHENVALPSPPESGEKGLLRVRVRFEGRQIDIFNTHWGLVETERIAQAEAAALRIDRPGAPLAILAGDLNETAEGPAIGRMLRFMKDGGAGLAREAGFTFPSTAPVKRIDFLLAGPGWRIAKARVVDSESARVASDHRPFVVEFEAERESAARGGAARAGTDLLGVARRLRGGSGIGYNARCPKRPRGPRRSRRRRARAGSSCRRWARTCRSPAASIGRSTARVRSAARRFRSS
jgi:endonuclease/exonuclease/phosphatase family metal-dependent hydrolase